MAVSEGYRAFVLEQLNRVTSVEARRMFGGVGLYAHGVFFALMAEDRLFFKVDDSNRPDYEQAGMAPFRPYSDDRTIDYFEVPIHILENSDALRVWTSKAVAVATAASSSAQKPKAKK